MLILIVNALLMAILPLADSRVHNFTIQSDSRKVIQLSSFGFLVGGRLSVNITSFNAIAADHANRMRFTVVKTPNSGMTDYISSQEGLCEQMLQRYDMNQDKSSSSISLALNFSGPHMKLTEGTGNSDISRIMIGSWPSIQKTCSKNKQTANVTGYVKCNCEKPGGSVTYCLNYFTPEWTIPIWKDEKQNKNIYNIFFELFINTKQEEGLYTLYFENCDSFRVSFQAAVVEINRHNYLSAGEIALPYLYFSLFFASMVATVVWATLLYRRRQRTFKTHVVMLVLVFVKSFTLLFHAINYHYIAQEGIHEVAWAVLYYITYLLKGALLFISIILIGAGWSFIKHILSKRDKKIFAIVIPLQILANVAFIIMEESEQSSSNYKLWQEILIFVDLVCCGAIILPIIWSIKHLQEASKVDGKVAINIEKLKVFRHFYIIIVGYIYFTRIIVYFLKVTVPFSLMWTVELCREAVVFAFYIVTGYMFRPASNNPYMRVAVDENGDVDMGDDDDESNEMILMDQISTRAVAEGTGLTSKRSVDSSNVS